MSLSPDRLFATPTPFALSLSKGCSFLRRRKKERCFDKLSTNGKRTSGFPSRPILPSRGPAAHIWGCRPRICPAHRAAALRAVPVRRAFVRRAATRPPDRDPRRARPPPDRADQIGSAHV